MVRFIQVCSFPSRIHGTGIEGMRRVIKKLVLNSKLQREEINERGDILGSEGMTWPSGELNVYKKRKLNLKRVTMNGYLAILIFKCLLAKCEHELKVFQGSF